MFASARRKFLPIDPKVGKTPPASRRKEGMTIHHLAQCGHCCDDGPPVDVVEWRRCRLLEAGFPEELAGDLASVRAVDIHALLQLVDRGCSPELAVRILAPIAWPGGAP